MFFSLKFDVALDISATVSPELSLPGPAVIKFVNPLSMYHSPMSSK
jgi:hypothetical protein